MASLSIEPADVPTARPKGLRLSSIDGPWWRIDHAGPDTWDWTPYPTPSGRFDPIGHRVRYAALTERGAFREHFHQERREIRLEARTRPVVRLVGTASVVDLRDERTLDLLGLDDEISVGRSPRVLATTSLLITRLVDWYGDRLHGVVYRSRTTPTTSTNLAFTRSAPLRPEVVGTIASRRQLLAEILVDDGFRLIGWDV